MTAKELKASILDRAIRGLLVPQDPHDEPAEALLARIREERAAACPDNSHTEARRHGGCEGDLAHAEPRRHGGRARRPATATPHPVPDDEKPFDIPKNWQWVRLGDVALKITDGEHKTPNRCASYCGYYLLSARNVVDDEILLNDVDYVDEAEFKKISMRCNPTKGDVLISCSGSIGRSCCVDDNNQYAMVRSAAMLRPVLIDNRYVMFCIQSPVVQAQFAEKIRKSLQPNLFLGAISNTLIPLPPLAEQKRIVAAVEELMPLVKRYEAAEAKRARLDAALPDALRKSILKAAFGGALPGGCAFEEMPLDRACAAVFTGNSLSDAEKRAFTRPDGLPFVGTKDVGFDQRIDYENGIRIPADAAYRTAPAGATLLCIEGGSSGRKIGLLDRAVRFGNKLCAFLPGEGLESRYLFLYLQSPQFLEQFAALQNGPRKGAGISQIKTLTIRMTSLSRQRQLVKEIDSLLRQADAIASVTQAG